MKNPLLAYALELYVAGRHTEAFALTRITDWEAVDIDGQLQFANDALVEFSNTIGHYLLPSIEEAAETFSKFADALP